MSTLSFHPEVETEIAGAFDWYESRYPGMGDRLLRAVDGAIERILSAPAAQPIVLERDGILIRRAMLARFPYAMLYVDTGTDMRVVALAHQRRRPGYWLHRVR